MRFASDIATALSAAAGRSNRPNGWQLVGAFAYGAASFKPDYHSRLIPE